MFGNLKVSVLTYWVVAVTGLQTLAPPRIAAAEGEDAYYRLETIATPEGVAFEVSGMARLPDGRMAVAIRKGEIWIISNAADAKDLQFERFASGLHEPMGLAWRDGSLFCAQRGELTRISDRDGNGVADEYLAFASGWGATGAYHEYDYGPVFDADGAAWLTLNSSMGKAIDARDRAWRGWSLKVSPDGQWRPVSGGLRSPSGLGVNLQGDVFTTDQQGNWVPTCSLIHLRQGVFHGHADSLVDTSREASTFRLSDVDLPQERTVIEAAEEIGPLELPAVWFPYRKTGMSATGILCDTTEGRFGPFAGQLFVGEFTQSMITRVYLEKVNGAYQGAVFRFREGLQCGALRMEWGSAGTMWIGETNRGWNSLGSRRFGLQRLVPTGETPFEIRSMSATPDGFSLEFTESLAAESVAPNGSLTIQSYTYPYHRAYGGDEIHRENLKISDWRLSADGRELRLNVEGLRRGFVHELNAAGLRASDGRALAHPAAYYTLNAIPSAK